MIKKDDNGKWKADIQIGHDGKRYRKTFRTKAEAVRWEAYIRAQHAKTPEWNPAKTDRRHLSELIDTWYTLHGANLKDGAHRKKVLTKVCSDLGNPRATDVTGEQFQLYRANAGIGANTLNHHLAYLKAVFNELIRLDNWPHANPLAKVRPLKLDEPQLSYLTHDQIRQLMEALATRRPPCDNNHQNLFEHWRTMVRSRNADSRTGDALSHYIRARKAAKRGLCLSAKHYTTKLHQPEGRCLGQHTISSQTP